MRERACRVSDVHHCKMEHNGQSVLARRVYLEPSVVRGYLHFNRLFKSVYKTFVLLGFLRHSIFPFPARTHAREEIMSKGLRQSFCLAKAQSEMCQGLL